MLFQQIKTNLVLLVFVDGTTSLSNLALLSIERETLECMNFDEVIDTFSSAKARRIHL